MSEVVELLAPQRGGFFVDATVGSGGHARALLESGPDIELLGLDRDPDALALARARLAPFGERVRLVAGNFADLATVLEGFPLNPAPQREPEKCPGNISRSPGSVSSLSWTLA